MGIANKDLEKQISQGPQVPDRYFKFRVNLKLLRYTTGLSAENLGKALEFKKFYRIRILEEGKANNITLPEIQTIAKYFKISIDDLLNKTAVIKFE